MQDLYVPWAVCTGIDRCTFGSQVAPGVLQLRQGTTLVVDPGSCQCGIHQCGLHTYGPHAHTKFTKLVTSLCCRQSDWSCALRRWSCLTTRHAFSCKCWTVAAMQLSWISWTRASDQGSTFASSRTAYLTGEPHVFAPTVAARGPSVAGIQSWPISTLYDSRRRSTDDS